MFNLEALISDPYNRKARLQPALLTLLPVLAASVLLVPEVQSSWGAAIGVLVYCGGAMWLTQLGRDRGKSLEPTLFSAWGGKPSVAMLRHRDSRISKTTKERYRAFLEHRVSDLKLPSQEDENRAPANADDGYESATAWLLAKTRDRERFRLIFEENINYGFRRNTWALKPMALVTDVLLIAAILTWAAIASKGTIYSTLQAIDKPTWAAVLLTVVHALTFAVMVRRDWVRATAEAYAQQLLAACDILDRQHATPAYASNCDEPENA